MGAEQHPAVHEDGGKLSIAAPGPRCAPRPPGLPTPTLSSLSVPMPSPLRSASLISNGSRGSGEEPRTGTAGDVGAAGAAGRGEGEGGQAGREARSRHSRPRRAAPAVGCTEPRSALRPGLPALLSAPRRVP